MEQSTNDAAVMDVQIKSLKEECVLGMGQNSNDATVKDARITPSKKESVGDTEQTAPPTMNLQLLLYQDRPSREQRLLFHIIVHQKLLRAKEQATSPVLSR